MLLLIIGYLNDPLVQKALHVDGIYTTPTDGQSIDDDNVVFFDDDNSLRKTNLESFVSKDHLLEVKNINPRISLDQTIQSNPMIHRWDVCNDAVNNFWAFNDYLSDTTSLYSHIYNHPNKPGNSLFNIIYNII